MEKLTPKQKLFVSEYLANGLIATKAYIAAGYAEKGAEVSASKLLRNPKVAAEIAKRQAKRLEKNEITADRVLAEISKMAFFDPRKCFNADSSAKQIPELDDDTAAAIAGFEFIELFEGTGDDKHAFGILKKFKLADKISALTLLARNLKLLTDKVEATGKDGAPLGVQLIHSVPSPERE